MSDYTLLPAQRKFFEIPHSYKTDVALYQGGFGSGKTFSGSLLGILLALRFPGIRGLVGAQTYRLLRDTTLAQYFEHLDSMGINYKYLKGEDKLLFDNGSEILFRHLEEDDKLKSLNLGFVELEEMSDTPYATFQMLLGRLRQKPRPEWKNFRYRLFGHTNPEASRGWIYENFVRSPKPNYRRILAPTTENTFLPPEYIQTMKDSYNEDYYKMYVLGQDIDYVTNLVTKNFDYNTQVKDEIAINPKFPIHITCDFNIDPMCWYIVQVYDGNLYIIYEHVECNTTTELSANSLIPLLTNYKNHCIIINGDASGNSQKTTGTDYVILRNALIRNGFTDVDIRVMNKNPGIEWRIQCWNNLVYGPDKKHHVFVAKNCKYLLYNIENLVTEEGGSRPKKISSGKLRSDPYAKFLSHPIDAVSYPVCLYYPIKDISRKDFGDKPYSNIFEGKYEKGLL